MRLFFLRFFVFFLRKYQLVISPLLSNNCKYTPTCSQYAIDAITIHGPIYGIYLTIKRLLKCNPCATGGYDPVGECPDKSES